MNVETPSVPGSNNSTDVSHSTAAVADPLALARQVLASEQVALQTVANKLDQKFAAAVDLILNCEGNLIVSGLGKSGLVGQKISATFASTGSPSHFVHPTEAFHGDLGRIRSHDVALLLSYSGDTEEITSLAAVLKEDGVAIISISKSATSTLGRLSRLALEIGQIDEACHNRLAPTSTTTAMMALGDALAIATSSRRSFSADDFSRSHPGGTLGKLMLPVREILRFRVNENISMGREQQRLEEVLTAAEVLPRRCGAILVSNETTGQLAGILTDSDLRRLLLKRGSDILQETIGTVMTRNPTTVCEHVSVRDAIEIIRDKRLDELPVVNDEGIAVGVLDVQDLLALKLMEDRPDSADAIDDRTSAVLNKDRLP